MTEDRPIKRRNAARTKARILAEAVIGFAEVGYSHVAIRDIAAKAGVDAALVFRYFGSKSKLFEAALTEAMMTFDEMDLSHARFGSRLTARFLEPLLDMRSLAMIVLSISDPEARAISARMMEEHAIVPLAQWLGEPDARTRAVQMTMLTTGFMLYTRQVPLLALEGAGQSGTPEWLADALQAIIDRT